MNSEKKDSIGSLLGAEVIIINPLEIISANGEISLRQYTPRDAGEIFALIDRNREHLSKYGEDTSLRYPTLESVRESIRYPDDAAKLRFGIVNGADV